MRILLSLLLLASLVHAQNGPAPPDDRVVATVDNSKITVAQLREMLIGAPQEALVAASRDQPQYLLYHFLYHKLTADALKEGLDKNIPYSVRLAWARMLTLQGALFVEKKKEGVSEAEGKLYYEKNKHRYGTAKVRIIFVAGNNAKAQAKAVAVLKQARAGADFARLARLSSDDPDTGADGGQFPPVVPQNRLPDDVRGAIFRTPVNDTTLVVHDGEQYLFKVEALNVRPWDAAKEEVLVDMVREQTFDPWIDEIRKTVEVKIEHDQFFTTLPMKAGPYATSYVPELGGDVKGDTVLAILNGKKITGDDYVDLLKGLSPEVRANAVRSPVQFLQHYGLALRLEELALKAGLDQRQPYKNKLRYQQEQILQQAANDQHYNSFVISAEDQRKAYDTSGERFRFAKIRDIYVSFSLTPPPQIDTTRPKVLNEAEAKEKVDGILKQIRAGAKFEDMVRAHSEDVETKDQGGERPRMMYDEKVPDAIKKPVFAAKSGDVLEPIRLPNGFWLLKVDLLSTRPYEEVKDQLLEEARSADADKWLMGLRDSIKVNIDDGVAFKYVVEEAAALAAKN